MPNQRLLNEIGEMYNLSGQEILKQFHCTNKLDKELTEFINNFRGEFGADSLAIKLINFHHIVISLIGSDVNGVIAVFEIVNRRNNLP